MALTRNTEWEGEHVRLVKLGGLPQNGNGYGKRRGGTPVSLLFVHQSAGNKIEGERAAVRIAKFHTAPPKYKRDPKTNEILFRKVRGKPRKWWIGGGRGWPGAGYTFVVPGLPAMVDGKLEVYRMHDDDVHSYHTGGYYNRVGAAVCFAGMFGSRVDSGKDPDPLAILAGCELIEDYLLPRYGIDPAEGLKGHFDAGKPACPGYYLEQWVRFKRGEDVPDPAVGVVTDPPMGRVEYGEPTIRNADPRPLDTIAARQQALVDLGYDIGEWGPMKNGVDGMWGEDCKGALLAFQDTAGITVDGRWGKIETEPAIRLALALVLEREGKWPPES